MPDSDKPVANPLVVLREEFDDWAVLFDPDTGKAFGLNPVGVVVWKRLDGRHTVQDLAEAVRQECEDAPAEAEEHVSAFVADLAQEGLVGYEAQTA